MSRIWGRNLLPTMALVVLFSLAALWPAQAEILRNGSWFCQPEQEKGTAMFEKIPPWWKRYPLTLPVKKEPAAAGPAAMQPPVTTQAEPMTKINLPVPGESQQPSAPPPEPKPVEPPAPFQQERPQVAPVPEPAPVADVAPEAPDPLDKIYFDYDKSDLRPTAIKELDRLAAQLKAKPNAKARITGHCDAIGGDAYNDALSMRRAEAAKRYLIETHGISPDQITIIGRGKREPVAPNETPEGRQFNRRGEFAVQ